MFITGWELQGHVSSIVMVTLAQVGSVTVTFPVMFVWSVLATLVFHYARLAGRPDLLERTRWGTGTGRLHLKLVRTGWSLVKAWLAGIQAFFYTRIFGRILQTGGRCWRERLAKATVLVLGLTVFGVPTAHHLLRKVGFERSGLARMGLLATLLNVPFRVLASAALINFTIGLVDLPRL